MNGKKERKERFQPTKNGKILAFYFIAAKIRPMDKIETKTKQKKL